MAKISFNNHNNVFFQSLKSSVEEYFKKNNIKKTGDWRLYTKSVILIPLALGIYITLLTVNMPVLVSLVLCALLGITISGIGFNVMHDACHGSYSSKKWVNTTLGYTLNAMGGNAAFWKIKHNILHHTYTNIQGADDDIAQSRLLRQSPTQEWLPVHRYQHIYLTFVYALLIFAWVGFRDFQKYFAKKAHHAGFQKLDLTEHVIFWISKTCYALFYIIIPILSVGWLPWLIGYFTMGVVIGIVLAYVFQLAHAVEGPEFDAVGLEDKLIETEWAVHQIKTTANFSPNNKFISWYVGGLNYQIEHHLFPRISHVHYSELSKIVREKCRQFQLPYHSFPTVTKAISSHIQTMKHLGQNKTLA